MTENRQGRVPRIPSGPAQGRKEVVRGHAKLRETAQRTVITGMRVHGDGVERAVTFTIVDHGPHDPSRRYSAYAEDSDGRKATGSNAELSTEMPVLGIHWFDFDVEP